ncbi:TPA: hypothetical protein U1617_001310 [Streptococcus suis]|nr:hypothetical protein [Streptococcus suis]NQR95303.1 hypothetical protein [Streptococcus suis]HEM5490754.1 hypothetical protein [Streptococcus suis]HEM5710531.1 hypothetical protein [Streptococcus suis]
MAKKSSFNYKKTVRNINKVAKAFEGNKKKPTRTKKIDSNKGISNISISAQPPENSGCLIPFLVLISIPIITNLLV